MRGRSKRDLGVQFMIAVSPEFSTPKKRGAVVARFAATAFLCSAQLRTAAGNGAGTVTIKGFRSKVFL